MKKVWHFYKLCKYAALRSFESFPELLLQQVVPSAQQFENVLLSFFQQE